MSSAIGSRYFGRIRRKLMHVGKPFNALLESAMQNPGCAGFRGLAHDKEGSYAFDFFRDVGYLMNFCAETLALLKGLELCWDRHFVYLVLVRFPPVSPVDLGSIFSVNSAYNSVRSFKLCGVERAAKSCLFLMDDFAKMVLKLMLTVKRHCGLAETDVCSLCKMHVEAVIHALQDYALNQFGNHLLRDLLDDPYSGLMNHVWPSMHSSWKVKLSHAGYGMEDGTFCGVYDGHDGK
ncbi:hypothetical protein VNO78_28972 [Psophocarpus tetragonolobus]|uniref:Uncharacterized protein n=1 Tax=Psophocarpus tetragonolobus TaxID=3891 RepID=A0AAN9RUE5_PSOTE